VNWKLILLLWAATLMFVPVTMKLLAMWAAWVFSL
jgi:hypothetical protein